MNEDEIYNKSLLLSEELQSDFIRYISNAWDLFFLKHRNFVMSDLSEMVGPYLLYTINAMSQDSITTRDVINSELYHQVYMGLLETVSSLNHNWVRRHMARHRIRLARLNKYTAIRREKNYIN